MRSREHEPGPHRARRLPDREPESPHSLQGLQRSAGNQAVQRLVTGLSVARFEEGEQTQVPRPGGTAFAGLQEGEQQAPPQEQTTLEEDEQAPTSGLKHNVVSWEWSGKGSSFISLDGPDDISDQLKELGSRFAPEPLKAEEVDRRQGRLTLDFINSNTDPGAKPDFTINPDPARVFALSRNKWGLRVLLGQDPGEDAPTPPPGEQTEERRSEREPGGGPLPTEPDETEVSTN